MDQKTSTHRHDVLAQELDGVRTQQTGAAQLASELNARVETASAEKARVLGEAAAAQQTITDLTREFREAQRKLSEVDRQLAQRGARLKLLQQLQERWEGFGEGAKAVLQGRLDAALAGAKATPVTQGLDVKPEFGRALEALLGSAAGGDQRERCRHGAADPGAAGERADWVGGIADCGSRIADCRGRRICRRDYARR